MSYRSPTSTKRSSTTPIRSTSCVTRIRTSDSAVRCALLHRRQLGPDDDQPHLQRRGRPHAGLKPISTPERLRSGWLNGIKHWQVDYTARVWWRSDGFTDDDRFRSHATQLAVADVVTSVLDRENS